MALRQFFASKHQTLLNQYTKVDLGTTVARRRSCQQNRRQTV